MKLKGIIALIGSLLASVGAGVLLSGLGIVPAIGAGLFVLGIALYHDAAR